MARVNVYSPDDVIALGACKYWDVDTVSLARLRLSGQETVLKLIVF